MTVNELKQEYNKVLGVLSEASKYMDDNSIPIADREAKIPVFQRLIVKTCEIAKELKRLGVKCTDKELVEGFQIGGDE